MFVQLKKCRQLKLLAFHQMLVKVRVMSISTGGASGEKVFAALLAPSSQVALRVLPARVLSAPVLNADLAVTGLFVPSLLDSGMAGIEGAAARRCWWRQSGHSVGSNRLFQLSRLAPHGAGFRRAPMEMKGPMKAI